ncbi:MAG: DNRLRE domain-containing protein [Bacteroidales bacterium]|jgi:hypothetical protein|nr:DNRLRE domain-containing protein [Bacteroidales bacterium]
MKKISLLTAFAIIYGSSVFSQTQMKTVIFKPGPDIGQDAPIFRNVFYSEWENSNYGNHAEMRTEAWTWDGHPGVIRTLLKFDELSTIPKNATILSAELKLYGVPHSGAASNSSYPGSPHNTTNPSSIYRVTSAWDEQIVTWNTQPSVDSTPIIRIPITTTQWNWNFTNSSANLVALVQNWVSNPETNFGFMMKLDVETPRRCVVYASSNHSDPKLWPELIVTYEYQPDCPPCEANFSYMVNAAVPNTYSFMASHAATSQYWTINGERVSKAGYLIHTFSGGNHKVCYHRLHPTNENTYCDRCITIYIEKSFTMESELEEQEKRRSASANVIRGTIPPGDRIEDMMHFDALSKIDNINGKINIYPNPTTNDWNIELFSNTTDKITISIFDMIGKLVYNEASSIVAGQNSFKIESKNLQAGSYIMQISGNSINFREIVIKH